MTVPHWRRAKTPAAIQAEVAVIGGGVAGVSAMVALQDRGIDAVLLERHRIGHGASTRNAGFLMRGAAESYALAIDEWGHDRARTAWRWSEENLELLLGLGAGDLPSFRRVPSCLVALGGEGGTEEGEAEELRRSAELMREDGFEVELIEPGTPGADDSLWASGAARVGLENPNDGSVSPAELMGLLASGLTGKVLEGQEVGSIEADGEGVLLRTPSHVVRARHALVCTNAYARSLLPALDGVVIARRGQMLAAKPGPMRLDRSYYLNRGNEYVRQTPDGTVVFGGCRARFAERELGVEDRTTPWVQGAIEGLWTSLFGAPPEVMARWAGTMGFSPDGLPLIGPAPGEWERGAVWFCGGFTGHGMSLGHRSARACVEAMLDGGTTPFPLLRALRPGGAA